MVPVDETLNWLLRDLSIFTDAFIAECNGDLELLRPGTEYAELAEKVLVLFSERPEFSEAIKQENLSGMPDGVPENYFGHKIDNQAYKDQLPKKYSVQDVKQWLNQIQWVAEHLDQIKAAIASVKEKRLLELMQDQGIMRAYDDLSRAFYRTLAELRRQQSWRQKMGIIDVTPE